jgi:hypothetical protein
MAVEAAGGDAGAEVRARLRHSVDAADARV